jgi:hypothetical protein
MVGEPVEMCGKVKGPTYKSDTWSARQKTSRLSPIVPQSPSCRVPNECAAFIPGLAPGV